MRWLRDDGHVVDVDGTSVVCGSSDAVAVSGLWWGIVGM